MAMSVQAIDDSGELGQVASNQGYRDLLAYMEKQDAPEFRQLADTGESDQLQAVIKELHLAAIDCEDAEVKSTIDNFISLLQKAETYIVIE